MMEEGYLPSKVVPRRSTNPSYAFFDCLYSSRREDYHGYFFRLDDKGMPTKENPMRVEYGNWSKVFFSNGYLFYRFRSRSRSSPLGSPESSHMYYVGNYSMKQTMRIPSPPDRLGKIYYSVAALGMRFDNYSERPSSCCWKLVAILTASDIQPLLRRVWPYRNTVRFDPETGKGTFVPAVYCWKSIGASSSQDEPNPRLPTQERVAPSNFCDDDFVKVATFDLQTEKWTTVSASLSDEFEPFLGDSKVFCFRCPPLYLDDALYWLNYSLISGPEQPISVPYPANDSRLKIWIKELEERHRSPCVVKLCLKTNFLRLIRLPHADRRNVGLLRESKEGRLSYCYLCPDEGLRVWVLEEVEEHRDDHHDMASSPFRPTTTSYKWRLTYDIRVEEIDFNDEFGENFDSLSVHFFNEELHTILFKIHDMENEHVVCFDIDAQKTVSCFQCRDYWASNGVTNAYLEVDPTDPGRVASLWARGEAAPYDHLNYLISLQSIYELCQDRYIPYVVQEEEKDGQEEEKVGPEEEKVGPEEEKVGPEEEKAGQKEESVGQECVESVSKR